MSEQVRCPRCQFHQQVYHAPMGKIVRNPHCLSEVAIYDECRPCDGTGYVPEKILVGIRNAFPKKADEIFKTGLRWEFDHYYFMLGGLCVDIEVDGYVHS